MRVVWAAKSFSIVIQGLKNPIQKHLRFALITVFYSPRNLRTKQQLDSMSGRKVDWHCNSADVPFNFRSDYSPSVRIKATTFSCNYSDARHNVIKSTMPFEKVIAPFCNISQKQHVILGAYLHLLQWVSVISGYSHLKMLSKKFTR